MFQAKRTTEKRPILSTMKLSEINELTVKAYNKTAKKYHELFKDEVDHKEYDREILDKFSEMLGQPGAVCDAGCGPSGQYGKYLLGKGHELTGIDISPNCISIARAYEPGIEFIVMDMMDTDFEDGEFDGVISFYSILFTPKNKVDDILKEFNRIMKVGGKLLIVVKKGEEEGLLNNEWYEGNQVYFTHFLEEEMEGYLHRNGFQVEFLKAREPYNDEISVERIYIVGSKEESCN
jgi:ubiquinone/menaquinone biosynthesis C-methylase UbiE